MTAVAELRLDDAHLAEHIARRDLDGRYLWAGRAGWTSYGNGVWTSCPEESVAETVRQAVIRIHADEAGRGGDVARLRALSGLLSAHRIRALVTLARGVLEVDPARFDTHPDLLCVANGVVDLATAALLPHDPGLLLTRTTPVEYRPGATSEDWLAALCALSRHVASWLQLRAGQAATGHPTSDDVLPVMTGGGANGKSTVVAGIMAALGQHATVVSERVLMARPSDHPTELTALKGARFALIEETPEARHLDVKRLKDVLGTPTMTARRMHENPIEWRTTHSLFLTTNYRPAVAEVDHGTWRRLALVRFPYTFVAPGVDSADPNARTGDPGLRQRLLAGQQGQHEAVLAWVVAGARQWYAAGRVLAAPPAAVVEDTEEWRRSADLVFAYASEYLTPDPDRHIVSNELFESFTAWLIERGHRAWASSTFVERFENHEQITGRGVRRARPSGTPTTRRSTRPGHLSPPLPARPWLWDGLAFQGDDDPSLNPT